MGTGTGKVAVVTGASRGVGKGVALALGEEGWTVYLTGRGPLEGNARLLRSAEEVTARGGTGVPVACDHRDDDQIAAVFDRVDAERGRVDLLVNNVWAGPDYDKAAEPYWRRPLGDWDSLIGVGLRAHFVASVAATARMVERNSGLIVNISSFGTRRHLHSVLYGVSKAALDKMTADMAVELGDHDVTVLSLWLGLVQTESVLAKGVDTIAGFPIALAETPEFEGRVIAALAADPKVRARSGQTLISAETAVEYGVTERDGRVPASHRTAFGGGPVFPAP
ncbi:SDR family NAD(P)-dependent oxidoreductase [Microtetraspora sp. AC03309]|uniref:SDR family NAD(P)-dependent oxidoreductase n=1 Tax=Microtetraspora sp. AC03309 TaxID=2779376 RepID=UPI001E5ECA9D|nr:SDR family NAD(P)-dependent oxidoreductase [Microtetraspora sp. AC03309]MCC5578007.1 SDR family NAD(P)-dependent oxidoreductase [Microtetraspora sp. AC03309]